MTKLAALGEILRRFRFHGVPGAPVAFGVPTDRATALDSELRVVFTALQDDQRIAVAILAQADLEAARIRSAGTEQAKYDLDASHSRAMTMRQTVASRIQDEASRECTATLAAARSEADRIERLAADRLPPLVAEIVRRVLTVGETG